MVQIAMTWDSKGRRAAALIILVVSSMFYACARPFSFRHGGFEFIGEVSSTKYCLVGQSIVAEFIIIEKPPLRWLHALFGREDTKLACVYVIGKVDHNSGSILELRGWVWILNPFFPNLQRIASVSGTLDSTTATFTFEGISGSEFGPSFVAKLKSTTRDCSVIEELRGPAERVPEFKSALAERGIKSQW